MAYHVIDGGAHALGVALIVEVGGNAAALHGVVVDPLVHLGGGHAGGNVGGHVVQHADVDGRRALDALDVGRRLEEAADGHLEALVVEAVKALVNLGVALLVLLAASAPAGVVAAGDGQVVIHG